MTLFSLGALKNNIGDLVNFDLSYSSQVGNIEAERAESSILIEECHKVYFLFGKRMFKFNQVQLKHWKVRKSSFQSSHRNTPAINEKNLRLANLLLKDFHTSLLIHVSMHNNKFRTDVKYFSFSPGKNRLENVFGINK